ncbi:MAG TPA: glycosyltransferase family 4 protein [Candidatus Binataceae bacterium]
MRIATVTCYRRKIGGMEGYLDEVIPELHRAGHETALFTEYDGPKNRDLISMSADSQGFCVAELGRRSAISALRDWRPDLIYSHGLNSPDVEAETLSIAPSVFFVHGYHGTCISGDKTFKFPTIRPCSRVFGPACLALYFPRRCGGRSPVTMARLYLLQRKRLALMRKYRAIVTASEHVRSECLKHGIAPERVEKSLYLIDTGRMMLDESMEGALAVTNEEAASSRSSCRLLFSGRMDRLKGGLLLLQTLPIVADRLERPVELTMAGDGLARLKWNHVAEKISSSDSRISIRFPGWLNEKQLDVVARQSDLLVVPSLWPEPFGRVGPEAGLRHLPVAAFAVGGIPEWLAPGVNGYLASGDPPTAQGLANAIVECLRDPAMHARLRQGAFRVAQRFSLEAHLKQLLKLFAEVVGNAEWPRTAHSI